MNKRLPILLRDYGGVVLDHINTRGLPYDRLADAFGLSSKETEEFFEKEVFTDYFSGILSYEKVWEIICNKYKKELPENHKDILINCMETAILHHEVYDYIISLQGKGYNCYRLSDVTKERREYFLNKGRYGCCKEGFFSCDIGYSKASANRDNDYKIYQFAIDSLGINASDCVFIDDSLSNLERARKIGMQTIHSTNTNETIDRVKDFLYNYHK